MADAPDPILAALRQENTRLESALAHARTVIARQMVTVDERMTAWRNEHDQRVAADATLARVQAALDAYDDSLSMHDWPNERERRTITNLRAALAQQTPTPQDKIKP